MALPDDRRHMAGERLAELREQKALTLRDLEELSGVGADAISKIENGHRKPRPSTLRKLARALGVEVEAFFREPAIPLAEAPREAGPPRVSKDRLQEHFEDVRQNEVDYLNWMIADFWRLALPDEKPQARFVPEDIDTDRAWQFLEHALGARNVFEPEERERINRGVRKFALAGRDKDS
jgi:transcriptional regulator with XRE-family HTH domain